MIMWAQICLVSFAIVGRGNRLLWCGFLPVIIFFTQVIPVYFLNHWAISHPGEIFFPAFIFCVLVALAPSSLFVFAWLLNVRRSSKQPAAAFR